MNKMGDKYDLRGQKRRIVARVCVSKKESGREKHRNEGERKIWIKHVLERRKI